MRLRVSREERVVFLRRLREQPISTLLAVHVHDPLISVVPFGDARRDRPHRNGALDGLDRDRARFGGGFATEQSEQDQKSGPRGNRRSDHVYSPLRGCVC